MSKYPSIPAVPTDVTPAQRAWMLAVTQALQTGTGAIRGGNRFLTTEDLSNISTATTVETESADRPYSGDPTGPIPDPPESFTITPTAYGLVLEWLYPGAQSEISHVEVWAGESDVQEDAWRDGIVTRPVNGYKYLMSAPFASTWFWIRCMSYGGQVSEWVSASFDSSVQVTQPTDLSTNLVDGNMVVEWQYPCDVNGDILDDITHVEILHGTTDVFDDANLLVEITAPIHSYTHIVSQPPTDQYYWIRCVSQTGQASLYSSVSGLVETLASLAGVVGTSSNYGAEVAWTVAANPGPVQSVEVWTALTSSFGDAECVGVVDVAVGRFLHAWPVPFVAHYYWARSRAKDGRVSEYFPLASSPGTLVEAAPSIADHTDYVLETLTADLSENITYQALVNNLTGDLRADYALRVADMDGESGIKYIAGVGLTANNGAGQSEVVVLTDNFRVVSGSSDTSLTQPFIIGNVDGTPTVGINGALVVDGTISADRLDASDIYAGFTIQSSNFASGTAGYRLNANGLFEVYDGNGGSLTFGNGTAEIVGTLKQSLKGDPGEQGEQGVQGEPGIQGEPGSDGVNGVDGVNGQSVDIVFKRYSSQPSTPVSTYNPPSGWYSSVSSVPSSSYPLWSCVGYQNPSTGYWSWETPIKIEGTDGDNGADGTDGANGEDGSDGYSVAEISIYRRLSTTPGTPSGGYYSFSTNSLTSTPSSWSSSIPSGDDPVYISKAVASVQGSTGTDYSLSWSSPVKFVENGASGTDGKSVEFIFRRTTSSSSPSTPSTSQTDNYVPTYWTDDPQGVTSTYIYEWCSKRTKSNGTWSSWSSPSEWAMYVEDGEKGDTGPGVVFRGEYDSGTRYYYTDTRRDIVKYDSSYYLYNRYGSSGFLEYGFNSGFWESFGSSFSSVATEVLFSESIYTNNVFASGGSFVVDSDDGITVSSGGGILVEDGGDITLENEGNTNPAKLYFTEGTNGQSIETYAYYSSGLSFLMTKPVSSSVTTNYHLEDFHQCAVSVDQINLSANSSGGNSGLGMYFGEVRFYADNDGYNGDAFTFINGDSSADSDKVFVITTEGNITTYGNILPDVNNSKTLGDPSHQYKSANIYDLYVGHDLDVTGSIAFDGSFVFVLTKERFLFVISGSFSGL